MEIFYRVKTSNFSTYFFMENMKHDRIHKFCSMSTFHDIQSLETLFKYFVIHSVKRINKFQTYIINQKFEITSLFNIEHFFYFNIIYEIIYQ